MTHDCALASDLVRASSVINHACAMLSCIVTLSSSNHANAQHVHVFCWDLCAGRAQIPAKDMPEGTRQHMHISVMCQLARLFTVTLIHSSTASASGKVIPDPRVVGLQPTVIASRASPPRRPRVAPASPPLLDSKNRGRASPVNS